MTGERETSRTSRLEPLLEEAFQRLDQGGEAALAAFCEAHPTEADAIRRAVGLLRERGLATDPAPAAPVPERVGPFRVLRRLGGGGMGVVYLARDDALGRDVALKLVRPDQLYFQGARERFRREVETIARLRHVGIVPLYEVGEANGLPYYAMEPVEGCTLAEVVASLRDRRPEELTGHDLFALLATRATREDSSDSGDGSASAGAFFEGSWETVCLRIVRDVAEALEHAHRHGIVHRDVKPSNVMLTAAGRVLLLDFGLSSRRGGERITRSGVPVGSLAYMPPEMLRGEADEDDPRLDVYSLGVTLYELATLTLPFAEASEGRLRAAILAGDLPPLRERNPRASWELETICQVATDRDPTRRYASAQAFARDLANALASRPLEARRPGPWLRSRRLVQRHPVAAAVLAALVVGPSVLAWREVRSSRVVLAKNDEIRRTNQELVRALDAADAARANAEENFAKALEAVDRMLTRVGDETLAEVPRMEAVRRELLEDALAFHEWFLTRAGDDASVRAESVRVAVRTAHVLASTGDASASDATLERAEQLVRESIELFEDDAALATLADILQRRAGNARLQGDRDRARELLVEAGTLATRARDHEDAATQRTAIAAALSEGGQIDLETGRLQAAEASLLEAAAIYESLLADGDGSIETRHDLSLVYDRLGLCPLEAMLSTESANSPDLERALDYADTAVSYAIELTGERPDDPRMRFRLARSLLNRSSKRLAAGRPADGSNDLGEAIAILEALAADFPSTPIYARDLAAAYGNAAAAASALGEDEETLRYCRLALDAYRDLDGDPERDVFVLSGLCNALYNLAEALARDGAVDEPLELTDEILGRVARVLPKVPRNPALTYVYAAALHLQGHLLLVDRRPLEAYERVRALLQGAQLAKQVERGAVLAAHCVAEAPAERRAELAGALGRALRGTVDRGLVTRAALRDLDTAPLWSEPAFTAALGDD